MSVGKAVLVVSDLHCGSVFGMLPPGFESSAGAPVLQNVLQKYLWSCWEDLLGRFASIEKHVAAVVLNGDLVDGHQGAQRGTELSLPIIQDQARAAQAVLQPLRKLFPDTPWYAIQGTDYHDGPRAARELEVVAENLGCLKYGTILNGSGVFSREYLDLEFRDGKGPGVTINFAHGISVAGGFYRATAIDREAQWSAITGKEGKIPKADCLVRSHCHFFVHVEHASKHAVITPCWQGQTRYMRKNSIYRMLPELGGVIIWVNEEAKARGEDPIIVRKVLYPLPPISTTRVKNPKHLIGKR